MSHTFKTLDREPVYVKVSRAIEEDILSGALAEGALLPTEGALCEQFGVTRSSVREGIRLLEQSGLVERGPAKRLVVRAPKISEIAATASKSLAHGGATFREVWETLALFYPQAAKAAATQLSAESIGELRAINARLRGGDNGDVIVESAVEFFQTIAAGLDNRVMLAMLQSLNMMIGASLALVIGRTPQAKKRIEDAQAEIIEALEAGDEGKATRWMTRHIDDLMRGYQVAKVDLDARIL
ncbi:FadR/GntR family transcriptional regulator [Hyphococcus sp.]|uniref:FadR/GntR family transcriptional regulator n=1 Tax=Hyphococcus sp. TaxID=2038636 RepID=UPI003CCBA66F